MDIDELIVYKGVDYKISDRIILHQPTLDEICLYGEKQYYQLIHTLTSVGADLKWQLDDIGVDYTKISDFELFSSLLIKSYTKVQTSILFGDLDFENFELFTNSNNGELCLAQKYEDEWIIIDEYTYLLIMDYLRKAHGLKRNNKLPANESTRQVLIDDDREEYLINKDKPYQSQLLNLISTMVNSDGFKYNHNEVWDMKICAFMDSVRRITKIKNADMLLQSGYSGYGIDLKKIDNKQIDWLGELD